MVVTAVRLPDPVARVRDASLIDVDGLVRDLAAEVDGEVRFDAGSRAAYSTDASNYRQVPIGVVVPRTVDAGAAAVAVCARYGAPITSRGGGTSLAGECTNVAVIIDWSKYCHRLLEVDPDTRTCLVEPGIVLDVLNQQLSDTGLEYGPEPATHNHCTLGGMIGNNSCGATAQRTGKVVDNVVELEVLLYDGTRMWVGETSDDDYDRIVAGGGRPAEIYRQLRELRDRYLGEIRTRYPHIPRRVSGYNLDSLLPEKNFHVAQALVGTEGTLCHRAARPTTARAGGAVPDRGDARLPGCRRGRRRRPRRPGVRTDRVGRTRRQADRLRTRQTPQPERPGLPAGWCLVPAGAVRREHP